MSGQPDPSDESEVIKELRTKAETADAAAARAATAERKLAFHEAGVDLASPVGLLLYESSFDHSDPEALKARWAELAPTAQTSPPEPPPMSEADKAANDLASGITGGGAGKPPGSANDPGENPYDAGIKEYYKQVNVHDRPEDMASAEFFNRVVHAAIKGDKRVLWTPEQHQQLVDSVHGGARVNVEPGARHVP